MGKIDNLSSNSAVIYEKAKAGYPALFIVTKEDTRTLREVQEAVEALGRDLYLWKFGTGLEKLGDKKSPIIPDTESPVDVLAKLMSIGKVVSGQPTRALVVLRDFHDFLEDPMVRSKLKDLLPEFKSSLRMLVITAPAPKIPPEIEKEVALLESSLPNKEQVNTLIDGIIKGGGLGADNPPSPERREELVKAAMGLTASEAENALSLSLARPGIRGSKEYWDPAIVMEEKCGALKKTGLLEYITVPDNGMAQVGGLDVLKGWIRRRKNAFTDKAKKFGLPAPKGILMVGPPGSGKSLSAKAISSELHMPLLKLDMGKMFGSLVGQSEQNMREAIQIAEATSPCILWVDEIEKGLAGSSAGSLDSGVGARVLGTILTWMNEKTSPVFVYATANDVTSLPAELLRKGRFDEMFSVSLPNDEERKEIFTIHLAKKGRKGLLEDGTLNLSRLVIDSDGYSGAEIEACITEGLYAAFDEGRELKMSDVLDAIDHMTPLSQTMAEKLTKLNEWCRHRTRPASSIIEKPSLGRSVEAN